jgi:anti-sigma B factor antagonist
MNISRKQDNGIITYQIKGDIDINSSPDIREAFEAAVKEEAGKIIVDLDNVSYIDSSGLATLVEMLKKTRAYGGKLRIANLAPKVKSLFEITKLEKLFDIFDTEQEAIADF